MLTKDDVILTFVQVFFPGDNVIPTRTAKAGLYDQWDLEFQNEDGGFMFSMPLLIDYQTKEVILDNDHAPAKMVLWLNSNGISPLQDPVHPWHKYNAKLSLMFGDAVNDFISSRIMRGWLEGETNLSEEILEDLITSTWFIVELP